MSVLAQQAAVVTGASSGIGRAIAVALGHEGARLCLVGRDRGRLEEAGRAAEGAADVLVHAADLVDPAAREGLARAVEGAFGGVDVLVHCAAIIRLGESASAPAEDLDDQLAANFSAPYHLTRRLLPLLVPRQGQIVFINSSAGLAPPPSAGAYSATKHALRAFADSLRGEVNPLGVRVLSVYPGRTATPMQESIFASEGRDYRPERLMQPGDVADMVLAALRLPRTAEVTDIRIRPMQKG